MNTAYEGLLDRRSVRSYKPDPVSDETLELILRAAMLAPSGHNSQPWHFVVIDDKALKDDLSAKNNYMRSLASAPLAILVCADTEASPVNWANDGAAATMNILHAAHALGLAAVWCGINPNPDKIADFDSRFRFPGNIRPVAIIALGCAAEEKARPDNWKPERIHRNRW